MANKYINKKEFLKFLYKIYFMHQWSTGEPHFSWNDIKGNAESCKEVENAISIQEILADFSWAHRNAKYDAGDVIFSYDDLKEYIEDGVVPNIPEDTWEMNGGM